jgi:hypothetical protein
VSHTEAVPNNSTGFGGFIEAVDEEASGVQIEAAVV